MTLRFLLDTNAISEPARPVRNLGFMRHLAQNIGMMCTSTPTLSEIQYGLQILPAGKRREELERYYDGFLASLPVLDFDERAARLHGQLRATLRRAGRAAPFADTMVAAIALAHDLTVVTANVRDFSAIDGLRVEDWTQG